MLVQALAAYFDSRLAEEMAEAAWEEKGVPYLIELGAHGQFLGVVPRFDEVKRGNQTVALPQPLPVPKSPVNRNSGLHPLLACDDIKYVLGPGVWTADREGQNHSDRHQAFVALLRRAAQETSDEGLRASTAFYDDRTAVERARAAMVEQKPGPGSLVALSMGGPITNRDSVRAWWTEHYQRAFTERNEHGGKGYCLVSGRYGPIAPTHDKIKGLANLGGQPAGVAMMSFDKEAFRSYGWDRNANSPVSPDRARAYVLALNDLLKPGKPRPSRVDRAGVGFLFWTTRPPSEGEDDAMSWIEDPGPEIVEKLLRPDSSGTNVEENEFYLLGVSGNGGRLLVRHWSHEALGQIRRNVAAWFAGLRIRDVFSGEYARPPKMWQVLASIAREEPPPECYVQLLRRALQGQPLNRSILASALQRLRVARGSERLQPTRMGLIRLCVNDMIGESKMPDTLNDEFDNSAYLCGRLLALYEGLQYQAQGELNQTVADRYFAMASVSPRVAFAALTKLAQAHLRKLRRDKKDAQIAIERQISGLMERILRLEGPQFPSRFDLTGQGSFALGFHLQKADSMRQARERKQGAEQNGTQAGNQGETE